MLDWVDGVSERYIFNATKSNKPPLFKSSDSIPSCSIKNSATFLALSLSFELNFLQ